MEHIRESINQDFFFHGWPTKCCFATSLSIHKQTIPAISTIWLCFSPPKTKWSKWLHLPAFPRYQKKSLNRIELYRLQFMFSSLQSIESWIISEVSDILIWCFCTFRMEPHGSNKTHQSYSHIPFFLYTYNYIYIHWLVCGRTLKCIYIIYIMAFPKIPTYTFGHLLHAKHPLQTSEGFPVDQTNGPPEDFHGDRTWK